MSPELISVLVLVAMFVIATRFPLNVGLLAFGAAFAVGTLSLGLNEEQILEGFPSDLFVTIIGVTYLFSVARRNGTIDLLVTAGLRLVGGRTALMPWVLFTLAALLTAFGTFTPAAVALLAPIGMNFAFRYRINPLLMGMMVISGGHAGAFSPIAVSGIIVSDILDTTELTVPSYVLFLASLGFNLLLSIVTFLLLRRRDPGFEDAEGQPSTDDERGGGVTWRQVLTLVALCGLLVGALGFGVEIGFLALIAGVLLTLVDIRNQTTAIDGVSWSTILLVTGMMTYVGILEQAGTIDLVSELAAGLGVPLLVALLLCLAVGVTSAFASSTALLATIIPIAVPLLLSSQLNAAGVVAALAISTTIVDVSPFSTNGALVLSNARGVDRDTFYRRIIGYTCGIVGIGPVVAWGLLVAPTSL